MSAHERWQLRYLDGWEASFRGDYANADTLLRDVIGHSGDAVLVTKASAMLMNDMGSNKRYEEAFELANRLTADLPRTQDKLARFLVLFYVSQQFRRAGQYDLAAVYARDMMQALPPGETSCKPQTMLISVLYENHKLTSSSPELQQGIDACQAAGEPVYSDTIWLVQDSIYLDEGQPDKAIALLNRIAPSIRANPSYYHMQDARVQLAQAYWKLGDDGKANAAALAALAASHPGDIDVTLRDAYEVLYRVAKKRRNASAALNYYEHYAVQNLGHLNDVSARTLAYDVAQQRMLAQKLETEKLSRQNNILRLQQTLARKTIETGRLYIALLLMALASVIFWLLRIKRSQLHFKRQARLDGLTGIFNHQHFISEAQRALHLLERRQGAACLVFIDLDHFKQINDTHGHAIGDALLKHTAGLCKQPLRANDLFGRLGGEEFGILLLGCLHDQGLAIAHCIRAAMEATPLDMDGRAIAFSASIGVASTQSSGFGLQRLCREADGALYKAKRSGRNRVVAHTAHEDPIKHLQPGNADP
ncbi:GGDEF domain-containing protein [Dyella choica]|uniref:diguanylate cyclase n=2 Tax=Dyella choica TaxID=1927959 RepID=A0A432M954_9GAMM|nr:GGDEF domain-containing protein [Dyella choica]